MSKTSGKRTYSTLTAVMERIDTGLSVQRLAVKHNVSHGMLNFHIQTVLPLLKEWRETTGPLQQLRQTGHSFSVRYSAFDHTYTVEVGGSKATGVNLTDTIDEAAAPYREEMRRAKLVEDFIGSVDPAVLRLAQTRIAKRLSDSQQLELHN